MQNMICRRLLRPLMGSPKSFAKFKSHRFSSKPSTGPKPEPSTSSSSNAGSSSQSSGMGRGPITFVSLGVMAFAGGLVLFYYQLEKEKKMQQVASTVTTTGKPALGGPFVLVDQDGVPRTDADFLGRYQLIYFGFSYCPDICPSELVKIGKILTELSKNKVHPKQIDIESIFISVDPPRDTVSQLKYYSKDFHEKITYLTGTKKQIADACKAYRVYFSKADENEDDEDDYLVDHSIVFYLVSPTGEFLDFFTQRMNADDVCQRIKTQIKSDMKI